jgi:formylglycine-generating enzyme required for sulfatase activity
MEYKMKIENIKKFSMHYSFWKIFSFRILALIFFLILTSSNTFTKINKKDTLLLSGVEFVYISESESKVSLKKNNTDGSQMIKFHAFYMSKHEVTFTQYDLFCEKTKRKKPSDALHAKGDWSKIGMEKLPTAADFKWKRDDYPVVNISWDDAKTYCKWLSKKTGRKIRLPYEKEWEYACRAGTKGPYYGEIDKIAWHYRNSTGTNPVMKKLPNEFGLYDMLGNVWEWCEDKYDLDSKKKLLRVVKGGSWINEAEVCTASRRRLCKPEDSGSGLGFRLVLELNN